MGTSSSKAACNPRLNKENHFMALAFWMECFPDDSHKESEDLYKKVGAVLVLPDDMSYAIDCSRDGVHAVARLIIAHPNIPEGCKVFVSRKPCSFCTKLLVQAKVERVFYLPLEPEYFPMKKLSEDAERYESETSCVDNLFKVSPIGQTIFVPEVPEAVVKNVPPKFETPLANRDCMVEILTNIFWSPLSRFRAMENLSWPSLDDDMKKEIEKKVRANAPATFQIPDDIGENMVDILKEIKWDPLSTFSAKEDLPWPSLDEMMEMEVEKQFKNMKEWMATFCVAPEKGYSFELEGEHGPEKNSFDPRNEKQGDQANHLMTLAKFLAMRTDDPTTGVGAVIANEKMKIVGLGWNGFPKKARYGEFARASDKDKDAQNKKYPFVIHAEQNALMIRNTKNIEGGTLFVTKTPCNECTPLLEMQGIKTVVLGEKLQEGVKQGISYTNFRKGVEGGKFTCFLMKCNDECHGIRFCLSCIVCVVSVISPVAFMYFCSER